MRRAIVVYSGVRETRNSAFSENTHTRRERPFLSPQRAAASGLDTCLTKAETALRDLPVQFILLSNPVQSGVGLELNSAFGSATAVDFTSIVDAVVTFPANSTASQTVNVSLIDDALNENDENFTLTLSGLTAVGNVTLGAADATGTIVDDDLLPQAIPVPVFNRWGLVALILMMLALPVLVRRSAA